MDFPGKQCRLIVMVGIPNEYIFSPEQVVHKKMNPKKEENDYLEATLKVLFRFLFFYIIIIGFALTWW